MLSRWWRRLASLASLWEDRRRREAVRGSGRPGGPAFGRAAAGRTSLADRVPGSVPVPAEHIGGALRVDKRGDSSSGLDTIESSVRTQAGSGFQGSDGLSGEFTVADWQARRYEVVRVSEALAAGTKQQVRVAHAMATCANVVVWRRCAAGHVGGVRKAYFCHRRFCAICERRSAMQRAHKVYQVVAQLLGVDDGRPAVGMAGLYLVSLTLRNVWTAGGMFDSLWLPWRKMRKRRPWSDVLGGMWAFEVTEKGRGLHPHLHLLVMVDAVPWSPELAGERDWVPVRLGALVREWLSVVGDKAEVYGQDIRPVLDMGGVLEIAKYVAKSSDLSADRIREVEAVLRGRRVRGTFGVLRGVKLDDVADEDCTDESCPVCGGRMSDEVWATGADGVTYRRVSVDGRLAIFDVRNC